MEIILIQHYLPYTISFIVIEILKKGIFFTTQFSIRIYFIYALNKCTKCGK